MDTNYSILITKLNEFIRKYYKNLLIRGAIYCFTSLLAFYLVLVLFEYAGNFNTLVRTVLFYLYFTLNAFLLYRYFVIPLSKLYKIGETLTHEQAAKIIGKHFADVKDRLLNTLQLKTEYDADPANSELIKAGIDQKIEKLRPVPFASAIDLRQNRKYVKYAAIPLAILILALFAAPSLITGPTQRLIHHSRFYEKEAPFKFEIQNKSLDAIQQEDYTLNVKITGDEVPENVFIEIDGNQYAMEKDNTVNYHYVFKNPQKNTNFQFTSENVFSSEYTLKVLPKPIILNFDVSLNYPAYIGKTDETLLNSGDLVIPEGTQVKWKFLTRDTRDILMRFKSKSFKLSENGKYFTFSSAFAENQAYSIITSNQYFTGKDSLLYTISVIPDAYPVIKAIEFKDSVYENNCYYKGMIKDDYGFKLLTFNYRKINAKDTLNAKAEYVKTPVNITNSLTQQEFYYYFDFKTLLAKPGDEYEYFFEVWDNDGVNGSKSTRSTKMIYKLSTLDELEKKTEETNKQIKSDLTQSISEAKKLQKEIEELNKKFMDKKTLTWQEKKQVQDLIDKQLLLQEKMESIQKDNFEKTLKEQQYQTENEELLKKQEELQKLFDQLPEDIKDLLKEMQEMLDKLDKNKVSEMLDKMKLSNKDLEKELDRNLQLFKQLEFEKKLNETIEKLDKLAEKQSDLSKETENAKQENNPELKEKQDTLNKEFEQLKEDIKEMEKKNSELEDPNKLPDTQEKQKSIEEEMKSSSSNLGGNKNKKASQSQKNASDQMKELSKKLEESQQEMDEENTGEDINTLRGILENLVKASFSQEDLMGQAAKTKTSDPKFTDIIKDQKKLQDNLKVIEDSLFALSKRQASIESFVNKEIASINDNVDKALEALAWRNTGISSVKQQLAMTSINNLALLLSETLTQMQQQQAQQKSGSCKKPGSCSKPGSGSQSLKSIKQMQEALNKQIQDLKDGKSPGKDGKQSMSESLAKLAAQQEAIRKQLQDLINSMKKEGSTNTGELNKLMDKMEKSETDLVNKILNNELLKRQEEILTRLLESEKAEKEREQDEKRESNESKNQKISNPADFFKYNRLKLKEVELLKTVPPSLKPFYKNKVNEYFYNFEE